MESPRPADEAGRGGGGSDGQRHHHPHSAQQPTIATTTCGSPEDRLAAAMIQAGRTFAVMLGEVPEAEALARHATAEAAIGLILRDGLLLTHLADAIGRQFAGGAA